MPTRPPTEGRTAYRATHRVPIHCPVVLQGEAGVDEGTVLDLADQGASIRSSAIVKPDEHVRLNVLLPDCKPSLKVLVAAVRWVQRGQMGVEFIAIPNVDRQRLRQYLSSKSPS